MARLLRQPLTWMVVAECAVVAALVLVSWRVIFDPAVAGTPPTDLVPAPVSSPGTLPKLPALDVTPPAARGPLPGLNISPDFWRTRLRILNADTAAFEALEWRLTHAVIQTVRGYVVSVILPAIRKAERRGG
jgi:hypothetical protein